ncbi:ATP-binding protein [Streptomyces sp. 2A115]|uniref:ATP-binding protein n=1 Tax=Streptomyces sp. 2A115 TaxID=3457439 RepID=UPI003FD2256A
MIRVSAARKAAQGNPVAKECQGPLWPPELAVSVGLVVRSRRQTPVVCLEGRPPARRDRVRDDGPGIPPHLLPSVFDRFTRGDASRARSVPTEGGAGPRLAIVAVFAAAHGGRIDGESEPGRTEFTLPLPPLGGASGGASDRASGRVADGDSDEATAEVSAARAPATATSDVASSPVS